MAIELECPRCHAAMRLGDEQAGQKVVCPRCETKVRVPVPEAMPSAECAAPVAPSKSEIEFQCPRCQSSMRVQATAAGQKLYCTQCGGKVQVPFPEMRPNSSPHRVAATAPVVDTVPAAEPVNLPLPEGDEVAPADAACARSGYNWPAIVVPPVCVGLIVWLAVYLTRTPETIYKGNLAGDPIQDVEFGPFAVDADYYGAPLTALRPILDHLEGEPLSADSRLMGLEFRGNRRGITLWIEAKADTQFYRVDPRPDKLLWKFCTANASRFDSVRREELARIVPEFVGELAKRSRGAERVERLPQFRNAVGLASMVRGIGYRVQAVIKETAYPCVLEDTEGHWYFILPRDVPAFEIVGRPAPSGATVEYPQFPGHYQVRVSNTPVAIRREPPKKKTGRELLGFGPKKSDEESPDERNEPATDSKKKKKASK